MPISAAFLTYDRKWKFELNIKKYFRYGNSTNCRIIYDIFLLKYNHLGLVVMEIYFYKNLKYLRKVYKISQEELSVYLQYSFQNISKWENDVSLPSYDVLLNIAKFFNMDVKKLVEIDLESSQPIHVSRIKIINNKTLYLDFQRDLFRLLYSENKSEIAKIVRLNKGKIYIDDMVFSEKIELAIKKEKMNIQDVYYLFKDSLNNLKNNGLIRYFEIDEMNELFLIRYANV